MLAQTLQKLAEQARTGQEMLQTTLAAVTQQLTARVETLSGKVDERLDQISGKVSERLEEGFKKTNETFTNVMARLATIDEAQKKIDGLTTNVVSLQEFLGDKRSRGAFGEVQLEALVANILPNQTYAIQHTLIERFAGRLRDIFTSANRHRRSRREVSPGKLSPHVRQRNHHRRAKYASSGSLKTISKTTSMPSRSKYILPGETSDGAVMFVPAEAVFAEIHAYHPEVVDYAMQRARVDRLADHADGGIQYGTRGNERCRKRGKQIHIIKDELGKLGKDFLRFDDRMKKLADHIRQANQDVTEIHVSSRKISDRFMQIERVELDGARWTRRKAWNPTKIRGYRKRCNIAAKCLPRRLVLTTTRFANKWHRCRKNLTEERVRHSIVSAGVDADCFPNSNP